ncbi:Serine/threonine-protein kinase WNK-related isoform 1 [Dorcoceras hygrometricum]|uniref:Serine/threonine-protein kinase WNK-related isoform 1 n=1 Tax=Dorcoceras hygrometricum TaxID=472368 RepID=A0A2Z7BKC8_9LAMI|nr:Serine/threonine-protein kinase WNK-related isoform 1 [Dorcoceras hygrometricum]
MVGSSDRSKEAVGMMALHAALRSICINSEWTYSVFWTIRPRPRLRGGGGSKVGDDNGSLMLMWEDGFCGGRVADEVDRGEDPVRKAFSKMSIQLYNYGEGLMGKVAADKCHKWVFKEPAECEPNVSNYWQSSFDALPSEWSDQFEAGIQTIAVIQAGHGLLQLGSCKIAINLEFTYPSSFLQLIMPRLHPALFNYGLRPLVPQASILASPEFQNSGRYGIPPPMDRMYFPQRPNESLMEDMIGEQENDVKWPNGLSIFNTLTGQCEGSPKLLLNPEEIQNEFLGPDSQLKMDSNFHRGFSLPSRTTAASPSTSHDHHTNNPREYRNVQW